MSLEFKEITELLVNLPLSTLEGLVGVARERRRQDDKWGEQNHPDGTGLPGDVDKANAARSICNTAFDEGKGTYRLILEEEVAEAYAESDEQSLMKELIQVSAVALAWVESIRRRQAGTAKGMRGVRIDGEEK